MKMIVLLHLDGDREVVRDLLERHRVTVYSEVAMEGRGEGTPGWYGEVAPYRSRMTFTLLPTDRARELMDAVQSCSGCRDPRHPIHALQLSVERAEDSAPDRTVPA